MMKTTYWFMLLALFVSVFIIGCKNTDQSFYDAATKGDSQEVVRLIDDGININYTNKYGKSALMEAIYFSRHPSHFNIVNVLINNGIDVNIATHEYGTTALSYAKKNKRSDIINVLKKTSKK